MPKYILIFFIFLLGLASEGFCQSINTVTPNNIVANTTTDVVIRGINTHFQNGISHISFSSPGITVKKFVVANSVTATATIFGAISGPIMLTITTRNETVQSAIEVFSAPFSSLRSDIEILPMEFISLKDIDLSQPSKTPVLFFANVFNDNTARLVDLNVAISSGTKGLIGTMVYNNHGLGVTLLPGSVSKFTNQIFDAVKTNGSTGKDFLYDVELSGAFPPDNYTYTFSINKHGTDTPLTNPVSNTTILTNPVTNPLLITPGAAFSDFIPVEYNPLPLFQWFGQNDRYDFAIYETRPGQTPEEVVRNIPVFRQADVTGNSFLYPNSAEKLIDGKTYAWQVLGKTRSASGTRYLPSEVFRFSYTNALNAGIKLVSSIKISPEEVIVPPGGQCQFTITCFDENNNVITDAKTVWNITPNGGTITQTGLFTAGEGSKAMAVLVCAGLATEFASVTIAPNVIASAIGDTNKSNRCNGAEYNPAEQRCSDCGGKEHIVSIKETGCCNGVSFDPAISKCIKGHLVKIKK
jgi:hypothetical protein